MESQTVPIKKRPPKCNFFPSPLIKVNPLVIKLIDVKPGYDGYNVYLKVLESEIKTIETEYGDLSIAEGLVGDETAVINFRIFGGSLSHFFLAVFFN